MKRNILRMNRLIQRPSTHRPTKAFAFNGQILNGKRLNDRRPNADDDAADFHLKHFSTRTEAMRGIPTLRKCRESKVTILYR